MERKTSLDSDRRTGDTLQETQTRENSAPKETSKTDEERAGIRRTERGRSALQSLLLGESARQRHSHRHRVFEWNGLVVRSCACHVEGLQVPIDGFQFPPKCVARKVADAASVPTRSCRRVCSCGASSECVHNACPWQFESRTPHLGFHSLSSF